MRWLKEDSVVKISLNLSRWIARVYGDPGITRALSRSHRCNNLANDYRGKANSKMSLRINRRMHAGQSRVEMDPPREEEVADGNGKTSQARTG